MEGREGVTAGAPAYWEARAQRFAKGGGGLRAVCSYGMPGFYNYAIHVAQGLALRPWLHVAPGTRVLDLGCGVGRWSVRLAGRGAEVTGVDLSPTMVARAAEAASRQGVSTRCKFLVGDIAELDLGEQFPLVMAVTVLQHILDPERFQAAVGRIVRHLAPGGRGVLLEAAPPPRGAQWDSANFKARGVADYQQAFREAGLRCVALTGVDPLPLKIRFLPWYPQLPRPFSLTVLAALTALSLPVEIALGRRWVSSSWHKLFVLERDARG